ETTHPQDAASYHPNTRSVYPVGLGGAWFGLEHVAHGIDFGSGFGQRPDWLDEAVAACRGLLEGKTVISDPGGAYHFADLRHAPLPIQKRLPIMIGTAGRRRPCARWLATPTCGTPWVLSRRLRTRWKCSGVTATPSVVTSRRSSLRSG
ncbi:MAG: LLM class flavin-dependent oxidoreductase, partial [Chloroflexi bacterium]|nr:LLM class flavin-dependent oxidoreductase [Chloroflexota bacterium]